MPELVMFTLVSMGIPMLGSVLWATAAWTPYTMSASLSKGLISQCSGKAPTSDTRGLTRSALSIVNRDRPVGEQVPHQAGLELTRGGNHLLRGLFRLLYRAEDVGDGMLLANRRQPNPEIYQN